MDCFPGHPVQDSLRLGTPSVFGSTGFGFGVGILEFISLETSYFLYRDANLVDVSGLETESSNGKDTLVSIIFLGL